MVESSVVVGEIESFLNSWPGAQQSMRDAFRLFFKELQTMSGVGLSFTARPGVSYSLRPRHENQTTRDFFAIVDVIDDEPENRWLSVCFYMDMITDPEERGECIPGGLGGSDGYCFDMNEGDDDLVAYLVARLRQAGDAAASENLEK